MSLNSFQLCRITGKSQFVPKSHSYFPLLPPISPAEAKKLTRKPNYIPMYHLLKSPTLQQSELNQYKCYQFGDPNESELYFYKIRDLVLLLPTNLENMIIDGSLTDMRMSRDTKIVQIMKKNDKRRWQSCDLSLCTDLNGKRLRSGSGFGLPSQLFSRKNKFEMLNSSAEEDEINSTSKIEPDLDKVERLRKKFDRQNLKLGLEPTTTKAAPSPFFQHLKPNASSGTSDIGQVPQTPSTPVASCQYLNGKLISGQIMETATFGPRFIPGQLINVEGLTKPVFIPGQVLETSSGHGEKFIPGIVFEIDGDVNFVPGKVEKDDDGSLKFTGAPIISTEQGLHFVAEDLVFEGGNENDDVTVQVQGFDTEFNFRTETTNNLTKDELNGVTISSKNFCSNHVREANGHGSRKMSDAQSEVNNDSLIDELDYSGLLNQEIQHLIENELKSSKNICSIRNNSINGQLKLNGEIDSASSVARVATNGNSAPGIKQLKISHRSSIKLRQFVMENSKEEINVERNEDNRVSITELPQTPPLDRDIDDLDSLIASNYHLDSTAAKHKISVRPKKQSSGTRIDKITREDSDKSSENISMSTTTKPTSPILSEKDRQILCAAAVEELLDTEKEFIQDLELIYKQFYEPLLKSKFSNHADSVFGNLNDILDFHSRVLLEGLKYAVEDEDNLAKTIGRTFIRLERYFDQHNLWAKHLSDVSNYLEQNRDLKEFLEDLAADSDANKPFLSQLNLPIQRLVDYKVILSDLSHLSPQKDLSRAIEFIETLEPSGNDDFLQSIEGFSGDLKKLGKLLKHDWFTITNKATGKTQERYLFLFKDSILVTKVRRITPERSIFIAKDLIKLPEVEITDINKQGDHVASFQLEFGNLAYNLQNVSTVITTEWLKNIQNIGGAPDQKSESKSAPFLRNLSNTETSTEEEACGDNKYCTPPEIGDTNEIKGEEKHYFSEKTESDQKIKESSYEETTEQVQNYWEQNPSSPTDLRQSTQSDESDLNQKVEKQETETKNLCKKEENSKEVERSEKCPLRKDPSVINISRTRSEVSMASNVRRSSVAELINEPIKSTQVEPGDSATFQVKTKTSGVVTWLKENRPLDDRLADRVQITSLKNVHKLVILNCRDEDAGLYSARVVDVNGSRQAICSGQLVVHELTPEEREIKSLENKPTFIIKFRDTELIESSTVCLMIHAKGEPEPELQIYKDGKLHSNDETHIFDGEELIIEDIQPSDGGMYRCVARNIYGSDEFEAKISVVAEKQLQMPEGDDSETCFQWFKDGHSFTPEERFKVHFREDEDSLALLFQHVNPGDAGLYTCVGATSSGRISCSAELTVQGAIHQLLKEPKAPCIITQLKPIEVNLNGSAMLELKVDGFPRPILKWYRNGSLEELDIANSANYKLIQDNEDVTLLIKSVELSDAGLYKIVASNELGMCDSECTMTIKSPPKFMNKLEETVNVLTAQELKLEAMVQCSPPATIKWYKDGKQIQSDGRVRIEGSSLKIEKSQLSDAGSYSVTASNELGQMAQFTNVSVNQAAKITKSLEQNIIKNISEDTELTIETQGQPEPRITWEINGKVIDSSDKKYEIKKEAQKHKLIIRKMSRDDSCQVQVKAANDYGKDESKTEISVNRPPKIVGKLKPVCVNLGESATFNIKVDSFPAPKVKWWLGDIEIDSKAYGTEDDGTVFKCKIPNVESSGTVKVRVANDYGSEEDEAQLTVKCKPKFKKGLKDLTIVENEKLDIQIELQGSPEPQVLFFHNGNEVTTDARIKIKKTSSETYHMTFNVVLPSDGGDWECRASNELGEVSTKCKITVEGVPRFEKRLEKTIEVYESETVEVAVSVSGLPRPILKWYLNSTELKHSSHIQITENETETEITNTFKIKEINLDEVGELKCTAENSHGVAETAGTLIVKSEPKRPVITTKLENVVAEKGTSVELVATVKCSLTPKLKWFKDDVFVKEAILQNGGICKLQLPNISELNSGQYSLKATTDFGEDESEAKLEVVYKPTIEPFKTLNIGIGEERTISPVVKANPPAKITWFTPDGEEIGSEQISVKGEPGNDGTYKVIAVNKYGQDEANLNVAIKMTPPELLQSLPRRQGVKENEDLVLKLQMGGSPLPSIVWLKDGQPVQRGEVSVLPDGTATLIIRNAIPSDSGKYSAILSNPNGELSTACQAEVEPIPQSPKFVEFPKSIELEIGKPLKLEGKISGFPEPAIKWFKDGEPLKPSSGILSKLKDGHVLLEIKNPRIEDVGRYTAILSNSSGECRQDVEVLPPTNAPKFGSPLTDIKVMEGYPFELEAIITSNPPPKLSLLIDGLPSSTPVEIKTLKDGSLKATVAIPHCLSSSKYSLVAENAKGSVQSDSNVLMIAKKSDENGRPPKFIKPLRDIEIDEGSDLKLEVLTEGSPVDVLWWNCDEVELPGHFDGERASLKLPEMKLNNSGKYKCRIINEHGEDECECNVFVRKKFCKPSFATKFTDSQQIPGRDCKFVAKVAGLPAPSVSWYKNGEEIKPSQKYIIRQSGDLATLIVTDCNLSDEAKYACILRNNEGEATCEASLAVVDKVDEVSAYIEAPYFLKTIGNTEVMLGVPAKFTACVAGHPNPDYFWYFNDTLLQPSDKITMQREGAGLLRLVINKPQESDLGTYRLVIKNSAGEAECTGTLALDSFESKRKPLKDENVTFEKSKPGLPNPLADKPIISVMTDRHLTLSWKPSLPSNDRLPVTYVIEMCECKLPDSNEPDGDWFVLRSNVRACVSDVHNLIPGRDYKFRIRVENKYGISDPSPYATTLRSNIYWKPTPWMPKDGTYDLSRPPHEGFSHAPKFLSQESDTQYIEKDINGSLKWWVYGYPKPEITIIDPRSGGEEIPLDNYNSTYKTSGEIAYYIKRMTTNDVGEYEAIARNVHGEARQRIKLAIAEFPTFIKHLDETFIFLHKSGKMTAHVYGVPLPNIKLFKDWHPLATTSRIKMDFQERAENEIFITISLSEAIGKDSGLYSLQATNCAGSASSSAMVHIEVDENEFNWHTYKPTLSSPKTKPFHEYYDVGDEIGRGTQGIIYHLTDRRTGRAYAGKRMIGERWKEDMRNERSMMDGLYHSPYISRMVDSFEDRHGFWIVEELCGEELVLGVEYWSERVAKMYIRQILFGLDYLHEQRIAHLGLNLRDILLAHDPSASRIKIIDFGLARHIGSQLEPLLFGQPEFVSPEIINGGGVGFPADIWAVGVITHLLLCGRSPFRGEYDRETLWNVQAADKWSLNDSYFRTSPTSLDFMRMLLRYNPNDRPNISECLKHPWLLEDDFSTNDRKFENFELKNEYKLLKKWYSDANCRDSYRRKPLAGAFTHPSKMVYPPGEYEDDYKIPPREPRDYICPETNYPRPDLDYDPAGFKSESHYQSGPDTYLLQLRDPDFPARLRQYMKVASNRSPALALQLKGTAYDRNRSVIRERRRFTDVMDEEVDDERKTLISQNGPLNSEPRRLRHELGARINAEKDAMLSVKREGKAPFIREKPCLVCDVGSDPFDIYVIVDSNETTIQWFKNDIIMPDTPGHKQICDDTLHTLHFKSPKPFDAGVYKILATNKYGQFQAKFRINIEEVAHFRQELCNLDYSKENEPPNIEDGQFQLDDIICKGEFSKIGFTGRKELGVIYDLNYPKIVSTFVHVNIPSILSVFNQSILYHASNCEGNLLDVLATEEMFSEQTLSVIIGQLLDAVKYLHWRGYAVLNIHPANVLLNSCQNPVAKLADFSELQPVSPIGSSVSLKSNQYLEYQAPELQEGSAKIAHHQTDIWSIGILVYILLSGASPFRGENNVETRQNIQFVRYRFEYLYKDITQEATRFIMAIFKKCPLNRPSYDECLEHRWLSPNEFIIKKKKGALMSSAKLKEFAANLGGGKSTMQNGEI